MQIRYPDLISVYTENTSGSFTVPQGHAADYSYTLELCEDALQVRITGSDTPLRYMRLRWNFLPGELVRENVRILGDAWERGYGDLRWQGIIPERCMPWYMLISNGSDTCRDYAGRFTACFGVMVRPGAMCFWQYDEGGATLWLDIRNGGSGVILGGRTLDAATVLFREYRDCSAFDAGKQFCAAMCPDPLHPSFPVYGSNNWYYAYGQSSHEEILQDTSLVAELTRDCTNRPFMVIDDGWQPHPVDGPWTCGGDAFPDMAGLAAAMRDKGVRPGIWIRYLSDASHECDIPEECHLSRDRQYLDPSHPAVLDYVRDTTRRLIGWGYQLIKHDYSTYDIFGHWGMERTDTLTEDGWHFHDRSRTSAEIVLDFYRTVREAAGPNTVIIGCNTISHLCAGLVELNRIGDDTSGREWDRTRKMGVNTLAFRMMQHRTFYDADADCVGIMGPVPWPLNRQWLHILSRSGSPLFVSARPSLIEGDLCNDLQNAFAANSLQNDTLIPLDWMETVCPSRWLLNGEEIRYCWYTQEDTPGFRP